MHFELKGSAEHPSVFQELSSADSLVLKGELGSEDRDDHSLPTLP